MTVAMNVVEYGEVTEKMYDVEVELELMVDVNCTVLTVVGTVTVSV